MSDVLFHASARKDLVIISPREESVRHPEEGPVVFARAEKSDVSVYLVPTDDSWTTHGRFKDESGKKIYRFMIISDEKKFKELDKGGAIYTLPNDTFSLNEKFDEGRGEWTSTVPVVPIAREIFNSGLDAMLQFGIQVYFLNQQTFENIQNANDHGYVIMQGLTSENKRLGFNFQELV